MNGYGVVVTKSTVPVGTAEKVRKAVQTELDKRGVSLDFDIASNPEFLKEGAAIQDFMKPDRIVVGVDSEQAKETISKLYKPFIMNGHPLIFMDIPSAEMTKYAANAMLATRISFMNDIANLCELMGADVNAVRKGIGSDPRIGNRFIYAGIGYGGSCFPKDVKALIKTAKQNDYTMRILEAVEDVNDDQKSVLFNKLTAAVGENLTGKKFAMWGLSFKPNTDDMREAPSLVLIDKIIEAGGSVVAYDPVSMPETKHMIGDKIEYVDDPYDALDDAEALLLVTEWSEFKLPHFDIIGKKLKNKLILDGRNVYDRDELKVLGFEYYNIGSSHLCDRFITEGYQVIAMDNLITGSMSNIEHLMPLENFQFYHHDVSKFIHIPGELDYILHFASPASPIDYLKIPIPTLKVGSLGTHNCLGLALAKGARMLIASTSEVYGDPEVHPQNEDYWGNVNPVGPRGVYDEAKRFQEAMTMAYHTFHGVETRIVRIFNTYGPRMRLNDGRALPAFVGQALRGEDITIFGDGSQTRSFCYVDDLVEGIYRLLHSDYTQPLNIGNPDEISILDFAKEIIKLTGTDQQIVFKDLPKDDPKQRKPDITRANRILDWQPK
eukprot:maker-scaffold9159_size2487-snap-gene-0.0 protein:Tk07130 transcript:maker-scaffold9159_size2487-snap-gene-0.0-mRNA-1 annotation:"nucleoside-diphosphate-sugar epimerase"